MARAIQIVITYDMDDPAKSLNEELQDWVKGNVDMVDVVATGGTIVILEGGDNVKGSGHRTKVRPA